MQCLPSCDAFQFIAGLRRELHDDGRVNRDILVFGSVFDLDTIGLNTRNKTLNKGKTA